MALGYVAASPLLISPGSFLFVDVPSMLMVPTIAFAPSFRLNVPNLPSLVGVEFAEQRVDIYPASLFASNPIISVVMP